MRRPMHVPAHLPTSLTICLWDFSWYVRSGSGGEFEDLDRAFAATVERGYNTVRICAMPFLLFGSGLDTRRLRLGPLGGDFGRHVRWYDVGSSNVIDGREHLLDLFRAAERHGCFVIVSSWEYQQSPAFALTPDWFEALYAIDPDRRAEALAQAEANLIDFLGEHGLDDRVAFVEIHNEVQAGHLADGLSEEPEERLLALRPRLERAIDVLHDRHPDVPVAVNYAEVPVGAFRGVPENLDVLVVHPYVYGVLDELIGRYGLRGPVEGFDQESASRELLRPGAPPIGTWRPDQDWRLKATVVALPEFYVHDWADPEAFDSWLYRHYPRWELVMLDKLSLWLASARDWTLAHGVPLVLGEGWIGYTPRDGRFEEGPIGAFFCRHAINEAIRIEAWGTVVCSNAAPHHAMWQDIDLQRQCNEAFTARSTLATGRPHCQGSTPV